jgi:hypothetical protein
MAKCSFIFLTGNELHFVDALGATIMERHIFDLIYVRDLRFAIGSLISQGCLAIVFLSLNLRRNRIQAMKMLQANLLGRGRAGSTIPGYATGNR